MIARWSYGLLKDTSAILSDMNIDEARIDSIKQAIEKRQDNRVSDIHVWKVGPIDYAVIISLVTAFPETPDYYKTLLQKFDDLSHVTIEVNHCKAKPDDVSLR